MFLRITCITVFAIYTAFALIFMWAKFHAYKKISLHETNEIKSSHMPLSIKDAAILLSERKYGFIQNYHIFQITNKAFGLLSITYSIIGLMSLSLKDPPKSCEGNWLEYLICFVSIIFVVLALYLTPSNRAGQYLSAWRKCDKKMCHVLAHICYYSSLSNSSKHPADTEPLSPEGTERATKRISDIAYGITSVIAEAESLLSAEES